MRGEKQGAGGLARARRAMMVGIGALVVTTLACMCSNDLSGIPPDPSQSLSVEPSTVVCASEMVDVTVAWEVSQLSDCEYGVSELVGVCDPITEFVVGCRDATPACREVRIEHDGTPLEDVAVEDTAGERMVTLSTPGTHTFTLFIDGEAAETRTIEVLEAGAPGPENIDVTVHRFCDPTTGEVVSDTLDLNELFSECVVLDQICNISLVPVVLTHQETGMEIPLDGSGDGACFTPPAGNPGVYLVRDARVSLTDPCAEVTPSALSGSEELVPIPLHDATFRMNVDTCGEWNPATGMCTFTASAPLLSEPPPETTPESSSSGSSGVAAVCGDGVLQEGEECESDEQCGDGFSCGDPGTGAASVCAPTCPDGLCAPYEDAGTCPADCGPVCGDGLVTHSEECDTGTACGEGFTCNSACACEAVPQPTPPGKNDDGGGDGVCEGAEAECGACSVDCGPC